MGKVRILKPDEEVNEQTTVIGFKDEPCIAFELNCQYIWDNILSKVHPYIHKVWDNSNFIMIDEEQINKVISQAIADELLYIAGKLLLNNLSAPQIVEELKKDEEKLEAIVLQEILDDTVKKILPLYYKVTSKKGG